MNIRYALIGVILLAAFNAAADEIEDQIKLGLEAYQGEDYKGAVDELNYAIAHIQKKLNSQNATLLPEPLDGWTAGETENTSGAMAMMGGGTNLSRDYRRGQETVDITIMAGSPMMAGAMAMISNPMVMSSNPDMSPYRYKRIKGTKEVSDGEIEVTLLLAGQIMVQVSGRNTDEAAIEQYLDAMDFDAIQSALLQ